MALMLMRKTMAIIITNTIIMLLVVRLMMVAVIEVLVDCVSCSVYFPLTWLFSEAQTSEVAGRWV